MPSTTCFSDPAAVPAPSVPRCMVNTACFSYAADLRRMPATHCFSFPAAVPLGAGKHDVAEPLPPGLRRMPGGTCFRY
jgi:hypothetical protein